MATIASHGLLKIFRLPRHLVSRYLTKSLGHTSSLTSYEYSRVNSRPCKIMSQMSNYSTLDSPKDTNLKPDLEEFRAKEEERDALLLKNSSEDKVLQENKKQDQEKDRKAQEIKIKILDAALKHVPVHGWSTESLVKGAEEHGYPGVAHGMFSEGPIELVSHFYTQCNNELIAKLRKETNEGEKIVDNPFEFLVRAVRMRLEMTLIHKSNWSQALAIMTLPQNVPNSLAQLLTLVDDICFYSGDRSVDFNWYTRRVGLATIYKMVELFMLQDTSPGHEKTWDFLKNRMNEAAQIQMMMSNTEGVSQKFQRSFNSAFVTARNILGIGYNDRR